MINKNMKFFLKFISFLIISNLLILNSTFASTSSNDDFKEWLTSFKASALDKGISINTINIVFKDVKFLEQVIKYDRKQPEFFEDTITYINKRATNSRASKAKKLLKQNMDLFLKVENEFNVEKEILLSLWGIETNFGKHVGKMDIISCLATLSFDKRRSKFFSSQLLTLLTLVDKKLIDPNTLFGSWAGAFGNFQFMPSSIKRYAIDYDKNNKIELKKSLNDSLASAANYLNSIGWKRNDPCFFKVELSKSLEKKYINYSAKKINNKLSVSKWQKKGVIISDNIDKFKKFKAGLIMPDGKPNTPTYLVFNNYEKILKWNRSLRFGITVCSLANMIKI